MGTSNRARFAVKAAEERRLARETEDQELILAAFETHGTIAAACRQASAQANRDISKRMVDRWLRLDADFSERFRMAEGLHATTGEAQDIFLAELAAEGVVTRACEKASVRTGRDIWASHIVRWRKDPEFAARYDEALEAAADTLEATARTRAVDGIDKPVIYQGVITDTYKEYSDTLLLAMLRARRPAFRDASKLELTGKDGGPMETKDVGDLDRARRIAFALARGLRAVEQQETEPPGAPPEDGSDLG